MKNLEITILVALATVWFIGQIIGDFYYGEYVITSYTSATTRMWHVNGWISQKDGRTNLTCKGEEVYIYLPVVIEKPGQSYGMGNPENLLNCD
jgi:hypothetical protein